MIVLLRADFLSARRWLWNLQRLWPRYWKFLINFFTHLRVSFFVWFSFFFFCRGGGGVWVEEGEDLRLCFVQKGVLSDILEIDSEGDKRLLTS